MITTPFPPLPEENVELSVAIPPDPAPYVTAELLASRRPEDASNVVMLDDNTGVALLEIKYEFKESG
jgi:hypothetical protein